MVAMEQKPVTLKGDLGEPLMHHHRHTTKCKIDNKNVTIEELYILTHPDKWPHPGQLPLVRRGGNPVWNVKDAGIVMMGNLCQVWTGIYLGDANPTKGAPIEYEAPEELLKQWAID